MAIIPYEKLYEGDDLEGATLDVMYLRSPGGTLKNVYVYTGGNSLGSDAVFNLTLNGSALWSGADRLTVAENSASGEKIDLSVETSRGDIFFLDLEECGDGGISSPLALILEFDDGTQSADGADGLSAYEIAVDNGFVGDESAWLESLIGADGTNGTNGVDGVDGADGTNGTNGVGVPAGGATDQILAKVDGSDYNTHWIDAPEESSDGTVELSDLPEINQLEVLSRSGDGLGPVQVVPFSADFTISDDGKIANQSLAIEMYDEKTTPVGDDLLLIADSENGNDKKKIKISNLPTNGNEGGGTAIPTGDLNTTTNTVEKIQNTNFKKLPATVFLEDNFNGDFGGSFNIAKWQRLTNYGSYEQNNGQLEYTMAGNGVEALATLAALNGIGKTFQIELKQLVGGGANNQFMFYTGNAAFGFQANNTELYFFFDGTSGSPIAYNAVAHRWLRMSHNAVTNVGIWETSPDAVTWTTRKTQPNFTNYVNLSSGYLRLQCNGNGLPGTQIWDNFTSDYVVTAGISDKSLYWYKASEGRFVDVSLADLKAALNALP